MFGKVGIKDFNDEPHFPIKKLGSSRIETNMLFKTKYERKLSISDKKTHKATRITIEIHERNKKFTVAVQPKNACKLESVDHLWLPFFDHPQYEIVVFAILTF